MVEAEVPSPVVGWLVPTVQSKTLYQGACFDHLTSGVYPFSSAKINQVLPLYLNTGLALPRYDCWFQICVHKSAKSSVSTDLGKQFVLDILPATLDEFVAWSELGAADRPRRRRPGRPGRPQRPSGTPTATACPTASSMSSASNAATASIPSSPTPTATV